MKMEYSYDGVIRGKIKRTNSHIRTREMFTDRKIQRIFKR